MYNSPDPDPVENNNDNESAPTTNESMEQEGDLFSLMIVGGFVSLIIITASISYKINTLLKHPDTPTSVMKETLYAIDKGYVTESEMKNLTLKLDEQLKLHASSTELRLHLGDLYRTNFEYRKAYTQYKHVADVKNSNDRLAALASLNGLLLDAFPKSFRNHIKNEEYNKVKNDCIAHPEKETAECTKITFSTFCAEVEHGSFIKNCQLFKENSEASSAIARK